MTVGFWYWLLMVIWLLWGGVFTFRNRPAAAPFGPYYWGIGPYWLLFLLLCFNGWTDYGDPVSVLFKGR